MKLVFASLYMSLVAHVCSKNPSKVPPGQAKKVDKPGSDFDVPPGQAKKVDNPGSNSNVPPGQINKSAYDGSDTEPSIFDDLPPGQAKKAAGSVTDFILVNAVTGEDLMLLGDNIPIDIATYGKDLTIRAQTANSAKFVKFNLDDEKLIRVDRVAPFYLAGTTSKGAINAAHSIAEIGEHTLEACTAPKGNAFGRERRNSKEAKIKNRPGCLSITFETVDSTKPGYGQGAITMPSTDVPSFESDPLGYVTGDTMKQYDPITVAFSGPPSGEHSMTKPGIYRAPSTFADYRLDCTFEHSDGTRYVVPGYFVGEGNTVNNEGVSGTVWACHFTPPLPGTWAYQADYREGTNVAQHGGGNPASYFDGATGLFEIEPASADSKGLLGADLKFSNGEKFIMFGSDSPVNFLAYDDFSGTPNNGLYRKSFTPHEMDYNPGEPTFAGGKGTALIGAINYLADEGVNIISVTTLDVDSADTNVFPFVEPDEFLKYDISKLAQWKFIMDYAMQKGVAIRLKFEDAASTSYLDEGSLLDTRTLYYREMVARFGYHPAVIFDIGEDLTTLQAEERSSYIRSLDPYGKPIALRTSSTSDIQNYASIGNIDGIVLQSTDVSTTSADTQSWLSASWFVISGEQGSSGVAPDADDSSHNIVRQEALWGNIMAGGDGIQYYFGTSNDESDLTLQDFRSRDNLWDQTRYAKEFFEQLPLDSMVSSSDISPGNSALVGSDKIVVYKKAGAPAPAATLDGSYSVQWYNPRDGTFKNGSVSSVGSGLVSLGQSPNADDEDWAILLTKA